MQMPAELKLQIEIALTTLHQIPSGGLKPIERVKIYGAFGPTFAPTSPGQRVQHIGAGNFTFTRADFARAWTSVLTAKQLLPPWEDAWANWETTATSQEDDDLLSFRAGRRRFEGLNTGEKSLARS